MILAGRVCPALAPVSLIGPRLRIDGEAARRVFRRTAVTSPRFGQ